MRVALSCLVAVLCACSGGPKGGVHMAGDPPNVTRFPLNPPLAGAPITTKGFLNVDIQPYVEAHGPLKALTNTPDADTLVWTLVIADPKGDKSATVRVPGQFGFPAKVGDVVDVKLHSYGGGPNVIPQLVVLDDKGVVLIAINDRPQGWSADKGRRVKLDHSDDEDEVTFTVKIGPHHDAEIDGDLREVTIDGVKFLAHGWSVERHRDGDTVPPDWVGSWTDFAVIRAQTVTPGVVSTAPATATADPKPVLDFTGVEINGAVDATTLVKPEKDPAKIQGYARVPMQNEEFRADVIVTSIATAKADERVLWTIGLQDDPLGKMHPGKNVLRLELPPQIALPLAKDTNVRVDLTLYGGGPNSRFSLLVTGTKGVPIIAIDQLPPDWETAKGKKLSTDKGDPYDAVTYAVKLGPKGKQVNLDGKQWRAVTIDGVNYVGIATTVERKLKKGKMPPPDYVGGWTDFTLIRVP